MTDEPRDSRPYGAMPPATGARRIPWAEVPAEVRASIERLLGGKVVGAVSQPGGFSAGLAARLRLADGGRAFVKAASSAVTPGVARFHRREIAISRRLPAGVPAPRLLDAFLAVHAGFLLRLAANAGPSADRHLLAMATALGAASLRWLRRRLEGWLA
jgi:hypothetical protein